jgi:hypothetical protein
MTSLYSDKKEKFLAEMRDYYRASQAAGVEVQGGGPESIKSQRQETGRMKR